MYMVPSCNKWGSVGINFRALVIERFLKAGNVFV